MNPVPPSDPRAELEARLTALLLGELPAAEAAALERAIAADPQLAKLRDELRRTIGLVRETVAAPAEPAGTQPQPLRLSAERRQKLLAHFQTVPLRPANVTVADTTARQPRDVRWLLPMAAAVAVMLAGASLFLPALSMTKRTPKDITAIAGRRSIAMDDYALVESQVRQRWAFDSEGKPAGGGDATVAGQRETVQLRLADQPTGSTAKPQFGAIVLPAAVGDPADIGVLDRRQPEFAGGQGGGGSGYLPSEQNLNRFVGRNALVTKPESLALDEAALKQAQGNGRPVRVDPATGAVILADAAGLPAIAAATSSFADGDDGVKTDFQTRLGTIVNRAASGSGIVAAGEPIALGLPVQLAESGAKMDGSFGGGSINGASPASAPNAFYYNGASTPALKAPDLAETRWGGSSTSGRDAGGDLLTSAVTSTRRDTEKDLELIDKASRGLAASPPEATIEAKFAQKKISDENAQALGLNWQLGGRPESDERIQSQSGTALAASDPTSGSQVAKSAAGTLRLNGGNTFAGGTVLNAGTLTVNGNAAAPEPMAAASPARPQMIPAAAPEASAPVLGDLPTAGRVFRSAEVDGDRVALETGRASSYLQPKAEMSSPPPAPPQLPAPPTSVPRADVDKKRQIAELEEQQQIRDTLRKGITQERRAEQEKLVASAERELKKREQPAAVESEPSAPPKPAGPAPVPQPEVLARDNAFSTFSLNVSDVSFKLAAASLAQGQWPDPASVRAEEFLNAFDYRDAEAAPGAPLAFAWERARAPFAHNRDLLRFSLQTAATGRPAGQSLNVVLVLDNSGSMERADRVRIVREALRALAGQFQPSDKLSVITFARTPRLWVDGASGARAAAVAEQVGGLTPEGGTNLEEALRLGYETARRHYIAGGINHVVLLTDGAANLGEVDPASLQQRVETHRQQGIALDCFGIGWEGFNDDLLETLARNGDGRYGFLNSPAEAATEFAAQLAGALKVAASDVKVQVEFNPRRVTAWRQIGYAKHQLTKEQFRDNTVDAAELAAQESGNALYTVEVNPRGEGPLATVRARFKVPGTSDYREHAWEVPFSGNAAALDEASSAMRLAATASAFAEWLASSPFAGEVTADRLLEALRGVPDVFGADARPKQLEEMIRQAKGAGGR